MQQVAAQPPWANAATAWLTGTGAMAGGAEGARLQDDGAAIGPRLAARRIDSATLLAGAREIEIDHHGELYRLRCTSKGKLILTK